MFAADNRKPITPVPTSFMGLPHRTFGRSGQCKSQRSCKLCASRRAGRAIPKPRPRWRRSPPLPLPMLETCRQQLDRIALGYGSTDCANAIPRSREGTFDLYQFAFWQFFHYERTASLEHPCSSICRVSRCYTCDKQGQDSKSCLPERMTTAVDDRLLTKPCHGSHRKSICRFV